jgi:predicted MFS family arabinose efflux permease
VLVALWLMMFSASSQVIIVSPILPNIQTELSIPEAHLGWLVTIYATMLGIFALVIGPISDKVGRRRILLFGCSAMSVTLLLHTVANTFASLLLVRGLSGIAGGMLSGAAVSYVSDYFPYERRGWANGWVMSAVAVGQIAGIPLGKLLAGLYSFRWPFVLFGVTMAVAVFLVWRYVPQPNVTRDTNRLSIGRALTNYGVLLREREISAATLAYVLMFASVGMYLVYLPTWLEREIGLSNTDIVLLFFVGGIMNVTTGPMAGQLSDRIGRKPLIVSSCLGLGLIMLTTTFVISGRWVAFALFALAMIMIAMRISPFQSLLTALVPSEKRGSLMSLTIAIGQIGMGLGSGLAGAAYMQYGYLSNTVLGAVSMVMMAAIVHYFLPEPDGTRP